MSSFQWKFHVAQLVVGWNVQNKSFYWLQAQLPQISANIQRNSFFFQVAKEMLAQMTKEHFSQHEIKAVRTFVYQTKWCRSSSVVKPPWSRWCRSFPDRTYSCADWCTSAETACVINEKMIEFEEKCANTQWPKSETSGFFLQPGHIVFIGPSKAEYSLVTNAVQILFGVSLVVLEEVVESVQGAQLLGLFLVVDRPIVLNTNAVISTRFVQAGHTALSHSKHTVNWWQRHPFRWWSHVLKWEIPLWNVADLCLKGLRFIFFTKQAHEHRSRFGRGIWEGEVHGQVVRVWILDTTPPLRKTCQKCGVDRSRSIFYPFYFDWTVKLEPKFIKDQRPS